MVSLKKLRVRPCIAWENVVNYSFSVIGPSVSGTSFSPINGKYNLEFMKYDLQGKKKFVLAI